MKIDFNNKETLYYLIVGFLALLIVFLGIGYSILDKNIFLLSPGDSGYGYGDCENDGIGFSGSTKILMMEGYKKIMDIDEGDILLGYDSDKGKRVEREVLKVIKEDRCDVVRLEFDEGNDIVATNGLFVFTTDGWKEVEGDENKLEIGDKVINEETIKKVVEIIPIEDIVSVYNLEVEDDTYFIDDPIMVRYSPCTPSCTDKECGGDGCGGVCNVCEDDFYCFKSFCVKNESEISINESVEEEIVVNNSVEEEIKSPFVDNETNLETTIKIPVLKYILIGFVFLVILSLLFIIIYLVYKIFKPSKKKRKIKPKKKK